MRRFAACRLLATIAAFILCLSSRASGQAAARASEHFLLDHNRIFVELEFARPGGTVRKALAFVDSGDPGFYLSASLWKELHLSKPADIHARFGGMPLDVGAVTDAGAFNGDTMFAGIRVEANLPATILDQYDVTLDYGLRTLSLSPPGTIRHEGVRVPFEVNPKTGLISVQAAVAGQNYPLAIDVGSAYTWIDQALTEKWARICPQWVRGAGAVGDANMNGSLPELTGMIMRLPLISLDGLRIEQAGALGVGPGWNKTMPRFFEWYSQKTPGPVVGFLGGNVLRAFRLEIDYANHATYWLRESESDPHDLDQVGILIQPAPGGKYIVLGLATQNGEKTVEGVAVNDQLVSVNGVGMTGATMGKVLGALHGAPGEARRLTLQRNGRQFVVNAPITRF